MASDVNHDDSALLETDFTVGLGAITAYSRLSYTMWYALAEFIDNSTQSRANYDSLVDVQLKKEGLPLLVEVIYDKLNRRLTIKDNSIGMDRDDLAAAMKIASPTKDSRGRSRYGMGMKTAACWIGRKWRVVTCELTSGLEWTAEVDVDAVAGGNSKIQLKSRPVSKDLHYTHIVIENLNRTIQKRTEETIKAYLGSMYRFDIGQKILKLTYNEEDIVPPDDQAMDVSEDGKEYRAQVNTTINNKKVTGWFGILRNGGRKFGGFSLFQNRRQIQGFPNAWKPRSIFGGVDEEGANNLVAQRLTGVLELDHEFEVSHTKDAILFRDNEEEELEKFLTESTKDYRKYAKGRRGTAASPWSKEKVKDFVDSMRTEFTSPELKDTLATTILPPPDVITQNNKTQAESVRSDDKLDVMQVLPDLALTVAIQDRTENDPHVTFVAGAEPNTMMLIINSLHPYYQSLTLDESVKECVRQYIYDAIAEFRVHKLQARVNPDSVRRLKDSCLRSVTLRAQNDAESEAEKGAAPTPAQVIAQTKD